MNGVGVDSWGFDSAQRNYSIIISIINHLHYSPTYMHAMSQVDRLETFLISLSLLSLRIVSLSEFVSLLLCT